MLAIAARQKRILASHGRETRAFGDRKTMPSEFAGFIINHQSSGIIIVVIEELLLIWAVSSAEEWINRIAKIPL